MNETKHTPGNWVVMHEKSQDQFSIYAPDGERWEPRICKVQYNSGNGIDFETTKANAELIADAPRLAEENAKLKDEIKRIEEYNESLNNIINSESSRYMQALQLKQENGKLKEEIKKKDELCNAKFNQVDDFKQENAKLKEDIEKKDSQMNRFEKTVKEIGNELRVIEKERDDLKQINAELLEAFVSVSGKIQKVQVTANEKAKRDFLTEAINESQSAIQKAKAHERH